MNSFLLFFIPWLSSILAIALLKRISLQTGFLVDVPEGDPLKIHKKSIPLAGGLGMAAGTALGFLMLWLWFPGWPLAAAGLSYLILLAVGLYDDLTWKHIRNINPMAKFFLLIAGSLVPAFLLASAGIGFFIPSGFWVSVPAGFVVIFLCINSVNYQDGMDGLAGGLVFISLIGLVFLGVVSQSLFTIALGLVFLGAGAGFLWFNFPPASVFMGDSGSYSLGLVLALLVGLSQPANEWRLLGACLMIGLPVIDGVVTNLRRLLAGKSIFLGDRSHFYDKLMQRGFSVKKTLLICYGIQAALVALGIIMYVSY
jgi:UDP-GlcNAc:undecaprenyl-phosphate GlcNAc-1-phosphate transferase